MRRTYTPLAVVLHGRVMVLFQMVHCSQSHVDIADFRFAAVSDAVVVGVRSNRTHRDCARAKIRNASYPCHCRRRSNSVFVSFASRDGSLPACLLGWIVRGI